jgi:hypothetical protein
MTSRAIAMTVLLAGAQALAQEKAYEAMGSASVVGGDIDTARRRALDDALRQAVDQAVADLVPEEARKTSGEVIKKRILRRAKAYTLRHKIVSEKEEGGAYLVQIEAQISTGLLSRELAAVGVGTGGTGATPTPTPTPTPTSRRPKLVALVVTRDGEGVWATFGSQAGEPGPAAAALMQELVARGFEVITAAGQAPPVGQGEGGGPGAPLSDAQAAEMARAVGAGGAVVAAVLLRDGGKVRGTPLLGGEAEINLRVLDGTARVSDVHAVGAGFGSDRPAAVGAAARAAVGKAMRGAGQKLAERWPAETQVRPGAGVIVRVRGAARWSEAAELVKVIAQTPGVRAVVPGRFVKQEIAFVVLGDVAAPALVRALKAAPFAPAPLVQSTDKGIVVERPAGQTTPGDDR